MSTVLDHDPQIDRLSRTVRLQWVAIAVALALAVLAAIRHEKPTEFSGEIDKLHVTEYLLVGEPPNTIELRTGDGIGAWVFVKQGNDRGLFMHTPEPKDGRPAFALRDGEYRQRFE